jgi:ribosomal protein L11 methyltransferase
LFVPGEKEVVWLEISVQTDNEAAEAIAELFRRYARGGVAIEMPVNCFEYELLAAPPPSSVIVKAYLPLDAAADELRRRMEEGLWHLGQLYPLPEPVVRTLAEEDWTEAWKQQYHRLRVGQRIVIVPAWEEYTPAAGEAIIRLEPGMAFGTGLHPTTRLCLQALETYLLSGATVLDVGTGSGILAIAAAQLGARSVLAIDADPAAVAVAKENVAKNKVAGVVTVRHGSLPGSRFEEHVPWHFVVDGSLELLDAGQFDLVLINILAPVIIGMAPSLADRLVPGGRVIAAGLIDSQEQDVVDALRTKRLRIVERLQEKDWVALVAQRR